MKTEQLKKAQKELIENFITDTEKISAVMSQYRKWNEQMEEAKFHKYSLRNFIFANEQLYSRTGNCIEILAPYKRWNKVNRNVRKGEKALWILAPINKKIGENDDGEPIFKTWFKRVPVFDLSQTDGDKILDDWTIGESCISWKELTEKVNVIETDKTFEEGSTDGEKIWVSSRYGDERKICILLHELAHKKLHFGDNRSKLSKEEKELEAETVSFMCSKVLGVTNEQAGAYISNYYKDNPAGEIGNRASKLVRCSEDILNELGVI